MCAVNLTGHKRLYRFVIDQSFSAQAPFDFRTPHTSDLPRDDIPDRGSRLFMTRIVAQRVENHCE